jgi:hypothetical protein
MHDRELVISLILASVLMMTRRRMWASIALLCRCSIHSLLYNLSLACIRQVEAKCWLENGSNRREELPRVQSVNR